MIVTGESAAAARRTQDLARSNRSNLLAKSELVAAIYLRVETPSSTASILKPLCTVSWRIADHPINRVAAHLP